MTYSLRTKVTNGKFLERVLPETIDLLVTEATISADATARRQHDLILAGMGPDGAPQKSNAPGVEAIKRRQGIDPVQPLYRTGLLADASQWRVRRLSRKRGVKLTPPKGRVDAVAVLRSRGYRLVLDWLPRDIVQRLHERIQRRLDAMR